MSGYVGDIRLGDTIDVKFTTRQISGAPATLSSSPVISAYPSNSTTELTAGITLTVDFDSRTGYNNVRIVATSGNGYATATNYDLCITTGTVNSVSVVGESIGSFSIENRSALMPTVAGRTLDVSATGEGGVDWANVGSPTTANALTNTSIIATQKVDVDTIKTNPVVNGGTTTFPTNATLASTTGAVGSVTGLTASDVGAIKTQTDKMAFTVANQIDANVIYWKDATAPAMTGDAFARLGAPAGASVSADVAAVKVDTAQIKADLPVKITKNVALAAFPFFMVDSTDHVSGKTGLTITATRSLDGAAFGACANSATEVSGGWYVIDLAASDLNGNTVALKFAATGADPRNVTIVPQPD